MTTKPRIHYSDLGKLEVGRAALVIPVDHPMACANFHWVTTSRVLGVLYQAPGGPVFETRNSIYLPAETDETAPVSQTEVAAC